VGDSLPKPTGQDRIWDYYQNEAPESFAGSRARLQYLIRSLRGAQAVLNIGCGSGILEKLALAKGIDIYSLDPSEKSIEHLRATLRLSSKAQVGYIQKLPFPDSQFDAVIVSEVLEHLTALVTQEGLAEIRRVLKPGGRIIGTVPSRENLAEQMVVCPCCGTRFHKWGHEQRFDSPQMKALLADYFESVRVVERPFIPWSELNWKGKLVCVGKLFLWRLGSHGANENIFFDAVKSGAESRAP